MKIYALIPFILLFFSSPSNAQEASDSEVLKNLLTEFLDGASRNDPTIHDNFWAEDLIYTSSAGLRYGKKEIMENLKNAPSTRETPATVYTADDIIIKQYGDMAIVAFKMTGTTTTKDTVDKMYFLNSGTFLKRNGRWRAVNWQATRIPE